MFYRKYPHLLLKTFTIVALVLTASATQAETISLTVEQAVERAMKENPALLISKATMDEQSANAWQATTTRLPRVDISGSLTRFDPNLFGSESFVIIEEQRRAQLRATHNLISGGRTHGQAKIARSLAKLAKANYANDRLRTEFFIREAFYNAQLAQRLLEVANEAVEINREELRRVSVQYDIGEAAKINLLRAEVQLANSIPAALRAKQDYRLAKGNLATMLAIELDPTDVDIVSLELVGELHTDRRLALPDLGRLLQAAYNNRPDIRAARAQVNAARGDAQTKWSAILPRVDLYGAYNWSAADGNSVAVGPFTSETDGWEAGASASMPLFDFFGNVKSVQAGRARIRQAEIAEEDVRRQVEMNVRTTYSEYFDAIELVASQDKNVERARESLRLARQLQEGGEATQLEVQQAQLDLTQSQTLAAEAGRSLLMAETGLFVTIGVSTLADAERYGISVQ